MIAGHVAMGLFDREAVNRLNQLGEYARQQIGESIRIANLPASVTGAGSLFRVHLKPEPPMDHRSCYADTHERQVLEKLLESLLASGFMMINTCSGALSTPMTELEIDQLAEAMLTGFRKIKPLL